MRVLITLLCLLTAVHLSSAQQQPASRTIHIGVVLDAPSQRTTWIRQEFERQLTDFFVPQYDVRFEPAFTITADGSVPGIRAAIDKLMANRDVEIVLALGAVSSHELARRNSLPKPSIAAYVIDAGLQELPVRNGASGVKNLNYVSVSYSARRTIARFTEIVPFSRLAILVDSGLLNGIPQLGPHVIADAKAIGVDVVMIPASGSPEDILGAIPQNVDAVYLAPLGDISEEGFRTLVNGFKARKLPSFSYLGKSEVELGILASLAPGDDVTRRARRVAITMQRIIEGEDAGTIPVDFSSPSQLTINMATARAIGFSPDWNTLTEAELLNPQETDIQRTLSLAEAVSEAVRANLSLQASDRSVASGAQEVNIARASLLPQVNSSATASLIRKETAEASLGTQAERQFQGELTLRQSIYSDRSWAEYTIQQELQKGRESDRHRDELDICQDAATSYLNVLRTRAIADIQRANLKLSISNLELARQREAVGASGKSDVYRWESEVASSRRNVTESDAQVQVAALQVNRILNRPLEEQFATREIALDDSSLITGERRLFKYFANPATFKVFRDFMTAEGFSASPELKTLDAAIAAQDRAKTSASRSLWLPDFGLQAGFRNLFSKGGAGSGTLPLPIALPKAPDLTWQVGIQVSFAILQGGGPTAALEQSSIELDKLNIQKRSVQQGIEQRVRASLHAAGASYASIQQARDAAEAARKNLELVTDAYSQGAASIITLIDAQNAALVSNEAAENSVYQFLIDLMHVERAIGTFDFFRSGDEKEAYFQRLKEFYRNAGVHVE